MEEEEGGGSGELIEVDEIIEAEEVVPPPRGGVETGEAERCRFGAEDTNDEAAPMRFERLPRWYELAFPGGDMGVGIGCCCSRLKIWRGDEGVALLLLVL